MTEQEIIRALDESLSNQSEQVTAKSATSTSGAIVRAHF